MNRSTFSVLFYANKSKVKNGIVPVMGRITINGTQSQFSCKRSIPLSLWDAKGRSLVRLQSKNLIRYQDTYAEQMAAYGLQRGIKGSEVQHISTHEYYRSLIAQGEDLQANIAQLLEEQEKARLVIAEAEQAKKDLARIKAETKTEELKNSATKTATSVLNGVNSLLGGNKVSRLEKENAQLHREVDELNERINQFHTDMQKMKDNNARELNHTIEQHQQEVSNLKRLLDKVYRDGSQVSSGFSIWSVSVCNMVSARNRQRNCHTDRPSIIVGGFTPMSIGAMYLYFRREKLK